MKNYKNELKKGIYLEDYNINIEFCISEDALLEKLRVVKEMQIDKNLRFDSCSYSVVSKIFDSSEEFLITFNFVKGKMTSVNLGMSCTYSTPKDYYNKMNEFLISRFGKPNRFSTLLANVFNGNDEKKDKWIIGNLEIVHELFDGFGECDTVYIAVKY